MFDSSASVEPHLPAIAGPTPPHIPDLESQHAALAARLTQVFARTHSDPPSITPVGHCVFIRRGEQTFSATISGEHILLLNNADHRTLGRYSTPAGLCRCIASLSSM